MLCRRNDSDNQYRVLRTARIALTILGKGHGLIAFSRLSVSGNHRVALIPITRLVIVPAQTLSSYLTTLLDPSITIDLLIEAWNNFEQSDYRFGQQGFTRDHQCPVGRQKLVFRSADGQGGLGLGLGLDVNFPPYDGS